MNINRDYHGHEYIQNAMGDTDAAKTGSSGFISGENSSHTLTGYGFESFPLPTPIQQHNPCDTFQIPSNPAMPQSLASGSNSTISNQSQVQRNPVHPALPQSLASGSSSTVWNQSQFQNENVSSCIPNFETPTARKIRTNAPTRASGKTGGRRKNQKGGCLINKNAILGSLTTAGCSITNTPTIPADEIPGCSVNRTEEHPINQNEVLYCFISDFNTPAAGCSMTSAPTVAAGEVAGHFMNPTEHPVINQNQILYQYIPNSNTPTARKYRVIAPKISVAETGGHLENQKSVLPINLNENVSSSIPNFKAPTAGESRTNAPTRAAGKTVDHRTNRKRCPINKNEISGSLTTAECSITNTPTIAAGEIPGCTVNRTEERPIVQNEISDEEKVVRLKMELETLEERQRNVKREIDKLMGQKGELEVHIPTSKTPYEVIFPITPEK